MRNRRGQFDVAHTLTANARNGNFNATFFADNTAMLKTFIFSAQAFVIFVGTKNFGTEQTITLWLKGTIVNGLRLFHLTKRP